LLPRSFYSQALLFKMYVSFSGIENLLFTFTFMYFIGQDVYQPLLPKQRKIDGAAFGCDLPHLLLQRYPHLNAVAPSRPFIPKIYGFRIHSSAKESRRLRGEQSEANKDKKF
jgi:hypothetical protein